MLRAVTATCIAAGLLSPATPAFAQDFVLIVNAQNSIDSLSAKEAVRLFLKKRSKWTTGVRVRPVDHPQRSPVRESFSKGVHGRSAGAIKSYWQKQIFSGRGVPPVEKGSEAGVIAFVRDNPGAIGYVSAGARLDSDVKVVRLTDS